MTVTTNEYYHVYIEHPVAKILHEVNLSKENIEKIALEYELSPSMMFDGEVIYPNRITKIYIYRGNEKLARNAFLTMQSLNEVKREFIKRPPARFAYRITEDLDITKEGLFIRGQFYDAFKLITNLIRHATSSIFIIDNHIDETFIDLLQSKRPNVSISIITYNMYGSFMTAATTFSSQFGPLEIRRSSDFHDRFLILDDTEYYHFGASFKDAGNKGFMFSRVEESSIITTLQNEIQRVWGSAQRII